MEGGEWSNFNAMCVNEEADFMAQLFPNPNNVDLNYNAENGSYYSSDSQNLYYFSSQETCYNNHNKANERSSYANFPSDSNHHQVPSSTLPFDFLHCELEGDNAEDGNAKMEDSEDKHILDSSCNAKKRLRDLDVVPKGKRNVRAKKNRNNKIALCRDEEDEDENEGRVNESLEDEDCCSKGTADTTTITDNSNGKTRASRGSATDPQSLYARKRREKINERLKILQGLVPNGTKVDISTMLEEAVQYVKFLQLQIKALSSNDHWMYAPIAYNGMNIGIDFIT